MCHVVFSYGRQKKKKKNRSINLLLKFNTYLPIIAAAVSVAITVVAAIPPNARLNSLTTLEPGSNLTLMPAFTIAMSSSRLGDCL